MSRLQPARNPSSFRKILSRRPREGGNCEAGVEEESGDDSMANIHLGQKGSPAPRTDARGRRRESNSCPVLPDFIPIEEFQHGFTAGEALGEIRENQLSLWKKANDQSSGFQLTFALSV